MDSHVYTVYLESYCHCPSVRPVVKIDVFCVLVKLHMRTIKKGKGMNCEPVILMGAMLVHWISPPLTNKVTWFWFPTVAKTTSVHPASRKKMSTRANTLGRKRNDAATYGVHADGYTSWQFLVKTKNMWYNAKIEYLLNMLVGVSESIVTSSWRELIRAFLAIH